MIFKYTIVYLHSQCVQPTPLSIAKTFHDLRQSLGIPDGNSSLPGEPLVLGNL